MTIFTRTFGIEIEFFAPLTCAQVAAKIAQAGVPCHFAGYTHVTSRDWKVVTDVSVEGGRGNGMELVSPVLNGEAALEQVNIISRVLTEMGCTINQRCGLHVHVDGRSLTIPAMRKLATFYIENESVLDSVMPNSRRASNNQYLNSVAGSVNRTALEAATDVPAIARAIRTERFGSNADRYVKLNFCSFWRHGTVEFRHHSGTIDGTKICNWVKACLRMCKLASDEAGNVINVAMTGRPTNKRLAKIYDLMNRPEGCSRNEVAAMLERTSLPPMNRILRNAAFAYRVTKIGREERYHLATSATTAATGPATLETLCARLQMTAEECAFWAARRATFVNDRSGSITRTPSRFARSA